MDSEVGMFVYGMQMIFTFVLTIFGIFIGTLLWGISVYRNRHIKIPNKIESIIMGLLLFFSTSLMAIFVFRIVFGNV